MKRLIILVFAFLLVLPIVFAQYDSGWLRVTNGVSDSEIDDCQYGAATCQCYTTAEWFGTECTQTSNGIFLMGKENNDIVGITNEFGTVMLRDGSSFTYRVPNSYGVQIPENGYYYVSIDAKYSGSSQPNEIVNVSVYNGLSWSAQQQAKDLDDESPVDVWQSCYFLTPFNFRKNSENKIKFKGAGVGASVHLDAFRISKDIPRNPDGTLLTPCVGQAGADPAITSKSHSPQPAEVGQTITFSVVWSDTDSGEVRMKICKSKSDIYCTNDIWCDTGDISSNKPITCTYTTTEADIGTHDYYAKIWDERGAPSLFFPSGSAQTFTVNTAPVNRPPLVNLSANMTNSPTAPIRINFSINCTDPDTDPQNKLAVCSLDFGDSSSKETRQSTNGAPVVFSIVHTYTSVGVYRANLTATDALGLMNSTTVKITVTTPGQPIAELDADPKSGYEPLDVTFTGSCLDYKGNELSGSYCTIQYKESDTAIFNTGTVHTYDTKGTYTAILFAIDVNTNSVVTDTETIDVTTKPGPGPQPSPIATGYCDLLTTVSTTAVPGEREISWTVKSYTWSDGNSNHPCNTNCPSDQYYCNAGVCTPNSCKAGSMIVRVALLPFFTTINLIIAVLLIFIIYFAVSYKKMKKGKN